MGGMKIEYKIFVGKPELKKKAIVRPNQMGE
jgi:hypothetical protein